MHPGPPVTVVIATRNRPDELRITLGHLGTLPERPPVVVVDNGSRPGTVATLRRDFPGVRFVGLPENAGAFARTAGVRLATTPLVAFCDDDSWWEPGALEAAARRFAGDRRLALLAGHVLVGPDATDDPTSLLMAAGRLDQHGEVTDVGPRGVTGFLACAAVVRRSAFLAVGGFERHLGIGGEEELVTLDLAGAGWATAYASDMVAHHHPSTRRDSPGRQRLLVRNHLITSGLRYSPATVARRSVAAVASGSSAGGWAGTAAALGSAGWTLARRAVVPPGVERVFVRSG